jgi:hypothetical protein
VKLARWHLEGDICKVTLRILGCVHSLMVYLCECFSKVFWLENCARRWATFRRWHCIGEICKVTFWSWDLWGDFWYSGMCAFLDGVLVWIVFAYILMSVFVFSFCREVCARRWVRFRRWDHMGEIWKVVFRRWDFEGDSWCCQISPIWSHLRNLTHLLAQTSLQKEKTNTDINIYANTIHTSTPSRNAHIPEYQKSPHKSQLQNVTLQISPIQCHLRNVAHLLAQFSNQNTFEKHSHKHTIKECTHPRIRKVTLQMSPSKCHLANFTYTMSPSKCRTSLLPHLRVHKYPYLPHSNTKCLKVAER